MIVNEQVAQCSDEWFSLRRGRPTASRFADIITAKTGVLSASHRAYMNELIAQCFFPEWEDFTGNWMTDRGIELEPEAREAFEDHTGLCAQVVGFCTRDDGIVGCSPDGLIYGNGTGKEWIAGLEIKCPAPKKHVAWVAEGVLPDEHKQQVHGSMAVTGLDAWHFFSYCPGVQPLHLVVMRDAYTEKVSAALDEFLELYAAHRQRVIPLLKMENANDVRSEMRDE